MAKHDIFFSKLSPAVHALLSAVFQRLDPSGIEAPILITKKVFNSRYDLIISPVQLSSQVFFFYV